VRSREPDSQFVLVFHIAVTLDAAVSHHVAQIRKDTIEALRIAKGVTTLRRHLEKPFDFQNGLRMNGRIGKVLQILLSIGTFRIPAPFSTLHNIRYRTLMTTG
jgi:hypothetical protein